MKPLDFRKFLTKRLRPTRELILSPGDPGSVPVTKIAGSPWWPAGVPRPRCARSHLMSFMAQFSLADIPSFEDRVNSIVSFHYCQECAYEGNMDWGWDSAVSQRGYDVSIFHDIHQKTPDGLGQVAEQVLKPQRVSFRDLLEVPSPDDIELPDVPGDFPGGKDDFDENIYPGFVHVMKSKIGGWPSWVQNPNPPATKQGEHVHFIAQLDWVLCERSAWGGGGYAYLFMISTDRQLRGELAILTT